MFVLLVAFAARTPTRSRCASTSTSRCRRRWSSPLFGVFAAGALFGVLALLGTRAAPAPRDLVPPTQAARRRRAGAAADAADASEPWSSNTGGCSAFPLFFGLGWIAARIDIKQIVSESRALPRSYFNGLNFLLNEQPDKAIEAFIEVVKVDPETIELHFALGSLFRRRGEYDRAIRMHQNLLERAGPAAPTRS